MHKSPAEWIPWTLLAGLIGAFALTVYSHYWQMRFHLPTSWRTIVWMIFFAPVVEEFAFRNTIQERIEEWMSFFKRTSLGPFTAANTATSLIFALGHAAYNSDPVALTTIIPSLYLGYLKERQGSVWPCVLAHAWFNISFLLTQVHMRYVA